MGFEDDIVEVVKDLVTLYLNLTPHLERLLGELPHQARAWANIIASTLSAISSRLGRG